MPCPLSREESEYDRNGNLVTDWQNEIMGVKK